MAVDRRYQDQGPGGVLLLDVLLRCLSLSEKMGLQAVTVEGKNDRARAFYQAFDFRPLVGEEYHLYLPVAEIKRLVR